jgi:hypothetical protein
MSLAPILSNKSDICVAARAFMQNENAQAAAGFLQIAETTVSSLAETPEAKALGAIAKMTNPKASLANDVVKIIRGVLGSDSIVQDAHRLANDLDRKYCAE